ncbi:ABC transporter ATP-binding protein [Candidatus Symbiobacter mobilis]|uniref:Iron complex transporter ATP-binding protein n=1 Tax=Candidatus Symbiobacter mobilis CR TaxID=946483 RepID=U5NCM2_9BURK|nr:ABC transporter ATP-binding protein [Candidatus Symbiobacter mobilis]AGX87973.1 iron complex transporter ATP-binding protein [Candidatus Symbiobacter mobilis CR]
MLRVRHLCFGHGSRVLLRDLDMDVRPGEMLAVLGPNGAGKTTLLKVLAHLWMPHAGSLLLDDVPLTGLTPPERARRVSYLPQQSEAAPVTVFEAVLLGRVPHLGWQVGEADLARVDNVLAHLHLAPLADRCCMALSGGELQKVLIGRALAQEPRLLLLDEPVNHLDLANQIDVLSLVRASTREQGLITLVVIHDLNLALRFADRFLLLDGHGGCETFPMDALSPDRVRRAYGVPVARGEVAGFSMLVPL